MKKKIVLLGATGSIGESTLKIIRNHPEHFELVGVAARSQVEKLAAIAQEFGTEEVSLWDDSKLVGKPEYQNWKSGQAGLEYLSSLPEADIVLLATVGLEGIHASIAAVKAGKILALSSKEVLVNGGAMLMELAKAHNTTILPVDSEHNALFQCLQGESIESVSKLILTASGGAFRDLPLEQFDAVKPEDALKHPNWDMGAKVTLDSATMANKGLELIEAKYLFGLPANKIDAVIHPQSIVHGIVEYTDGCHVMQANPPVMTFAIQHCLFYPERAPRETTAPLDWKVTQELNFKTLDATRYPCFRLARESLETSNAHTIAYNASNEVAGEAFLKSKIRFTEIAMVIDKVLGKTSNQEVRDFDTLVDFYTQSSRIANEIIHGL